MGIANLVHEFIFVDGDAQARLGGQWPMTVGHRQQGLGQQLHVVVVPALLSQEIRDGASYLQAGSQRAGPLRIVWCQRRIIRFGHPGDDLQLGNTAGVADIGLEDSSGALFEDLFKAPLGKDAFAGGQWDMSFLRELGHNIDIEGLHDFFIEPGLVRFQGFHQQKGGRWLHGAVKVDTNVNARTVKVDTNAQGRRQSLCCRRRWRF